MRALHVFAPAQYGGLERVVHALASGMAGRGHAVHAAPVLSAPAEGHPVVAALRAGGVEVHPVVVAGRGYLRERAEVAALCGRLRPDVVHTHGYRADVVHGPAARARGIAAVATVHGFTGGGVRNRVYEGVQRAVLRRFDAVVAVSAPLAARLARWGVPRVRTIANAWDGHAGTLGRAEARARLGVPELAFHMGWVGRLGYEKGADLFLDAAALAAALPLRASVLGDGAQRRALEQRAARLGIASRVRFHGAVEGAGALFAGFDAFVLSSRTEGTPMVLFEAMAAGVPIVATRVGGVPDVVGEEEALLVPPGDPAALAAAIRTLYRDPDGARRRADAARERLHARFGAAPWLAAYESLYGELRAGG